MRNYQMALYAAIHPLIDAVASLQIIASHLESVLPE
jgi:hypothetical protein